MQSWQVGVGSTRNHGNLVGFSDVTNLVTSDASWASTLDVTWDLDDAHASATYVALRCWNGANISAFARPPAIFKVDATPPVCIIPGQGWPLAQLGEGTWLTYKWVNLSPNPSPNPISPPTPPPNPISTLCSGQGAERHD